MDCTKFEELGLLYVSGELDGGEAREFEAHLEECPDCRREVEEYKSGRESLFTPELLGESPPEAVDREILRACAAAPAKMFSMGMMFVSLRKYAPIPIMLMLLMVAVGGYVRYHMMTAESMAVKMPEAIPAKTVTEDSIPLIDYAEIVKADTIKGDTQTHQNIGKAEGVVPVSKEKKQGGE